MKKIITILLGLTIAASANAFDLSNRFYVGATAGATVPFYENQDIGDKKFTPNLGLVVGKGFGQWGLEASAMLLSYQTENVNGGIVLTQVGLMNINAKLSIYDWMFAGNAYYNIYANDKLTVRVLGGLAAIKSSINVKGSANVSGSVYEVNRTQYLDMKLGVQAGIGTQYALSNNLSVTTSLNYLKPFDHKYLSNVVYANVGLNIHI